MIISFSTLACEWRYSVEVEKFWCLILFLVYSSYFLNICVKSLHHFFFSHFKQWFTLANPIKIVEIYLFLARSTCSLNDFHWNFRDFANNAAKACVLFPFALRNSAITRSRGKPFSTISATSDSVNLSVGSTASPLVDVELAPDPLAANKNTN